MVTKTCTSKRLKAGNLQKSACRIKEMGIWHTQTQSWNAQKNLHGKNLGELPGKPK
jgi:hypothetical protein